MSYHIQGSLLEVCTCKVLCPCWVGEDPDFVDCKSAMAWNFEQGNIDGVDVKGLTIGLAVFIPGNVLDGNWRVTMFIDENANDEQAAAIQAVYSGTKGGPVKDLIQLVGDVTSVERVPIIFNAKEGKGTLKIGDVAYAELEAYRSATGEITTLTNTIFSTVPGAPAYVGKASKFVIKSEPLNIDLDIEGFNAIQSDFLFEHLSE
ncbi:DUF1326 domain-containing protein [Shewanella surugensis]|uniref:DUF1326 domain-containing protein n=1 Tax=Shewanella surugensis TaxID=212020 RepID=A0ABT0LE43_9GAMM|nr:DUF1326 domain-containing protein [Shewanella surugensis]MCL1125829.1 DUF1326 domain-containing protein [Shewanella surugensis]